MVDNGMKTGRRKALRTPEGGPQIHEHEQPTRVPGERKQVEVASIEHLRFEELLSNLSARFVNPSPDQVDAKIGESLGEFLAFLGVDHLSLLRDLPEKASWQVIHAASRKDVPTLLRGATLPASANPWAYDKLIRKREVLAVSRLDDLPPEADVDRQTWIEGGIRAVLAVPISVGESVQQVIAVHQVRRDTLWPGELVARLRLLGALFAVALQGRQMKAASEELSRFERLISDLSSRFVNMPSERVDSEIEGGQRQICELLGLDRSALFEFPEGVPREMVLTCVYESEGSPRAPERVNAAEFFPWLVQKTLSGETIIASTLSDWPPEAAKDRENLRRLGTKSTVVVPLSVGGGTIFGGLTFASIRKERDWSPVILERIQLVAQVFSNALARKNADRDVHKYLEAIEDLKQRLERENVYLREKVKLLAEHTEIVGQSIAMRKVLAQAEQVARTDSTVLVQGETGTGKELVARAVHRLSSRKERPLVTVNCASLPPTLIESELFGRERGAYTGALTKMVGRFEVADGSTLFLDEIGELPLDVQSKLLRVLEGGGFERLGSTNTLQVNVRIIAATNRDLGEEVKAGRFRKDLYYRLNVFPIVIPPLRERVEDIPLLVTAFVETFQRRMGKEIETISKKSIEALKSYAWPGNVRELKNVIERAMILSDGNTLVIHLPFSEPAPKDVTQDLRNMEQMHIAHVLEMTGWRLAGKGGAAETLGLKRTTLLTKMKKLGIKRPGR